MRHTKERVRNITIKLGYANSKLYKCPTCPVPECFKSFGSSMDDSPKCTTPGCESTLLLIRHVSFVDCPGHDVLMATMLAGAAVMDSALLLIAGNQPCPQPQTSEHLAAVEIMRLQHIIILQNKIDIIVKDQSAANKQFEDIKKFVQGSIAEGAPIIPISAQLRYNVDVVVDYICRIPIPLRDFTSAPQMIVIRSFDVNKPGEDAETLKGGVAGGTILKGVLKIGDKIEIRPGMIRKDSKTGQVSWEQIYSRIISLQADENHLMYAVPGGLIGVGMKLDPYITRSDRLVGQIIGHPGKMPDVVVEVDAQYYLLRRLLGVKSEGDKSKSKVQKLKVDETLMINIGSTSLGGKVVSFNADVVRIQFIMPVCANEGEKIAMSRRIDRNFRLIGWGQIKKGYTQKSKKQ